MGKVVSPSNEPESDGRVQLVKSALSIALAAAFAAAPQVADAAGLGRLTVQSALGQPLQAEVEITALTREEAATLSARLAPPEAFADAGLEYNPALTGLRFEIQQRQGERPTVAIRSVRPINEPFIDLLVELNWATGKFVREYTFLLDPPELQFGRSAPQDARTPVTPPALTAPAVAAPSTAALPGTPPATPSQARTPAAQPAAPAVAQAPAQSSPAPARSAPAAQPQPAAASARPAPAQPAAPQPAARVAEPVRATPAPAAAARPEAPRERVVQRGDTLAEIAESVRGADVSLDQAIVAIYQRNPDAFFGSVHQLRAGATLQIPASIDMAAVDATAARDEIRRSNQVFRDYRARIAERTREATVTATPAGDAAGNGATAAVGQIGEASEPVTETRGAGDQLELSREGAGASSGPASASTGSSDATAAESAIARNIALRNAQERVTELERNVADLQRLLELKNRQLADLSSRADSLSSSPATAGAAAAAGGALSAATDSPAAARATPIPSSRVEANDSPAPRAAEPMAAAPAAPPTTTLEGGQPPATAATEPAASPADPASAPERAARTAAAEAREIVRSESAPVTPAPTPVATAQPAAQAEGGVMGMLDDAREMVLGNPYVPAGLAVLLGLAGLFAWKRRRSADGEAPVEDTLGGDDAFTSNSLFGTTGGQDVDTSNSLFGSVTAESEASVDVHSTEVDPIAEAEVYIAYGREAQAEEILREALKRQPDRQAIRLKLLEIAAGRKDATAYAHLAREMYDQTGGQNEEWPKVITMGLAIDPDNPLYTGEVSGGGRTDSAPPQLTATAQAVRSGLVDPLTGAARAGEPSLGKGGSAADDLRGVLESEGFGSDNLRLGDGDDLSPRTGESLGMDSQALVADTYTKVEEELGALDFDLDTAADMGATKSASRSDEIEGMAAGGEELSGLSLDLDEDSRSLNMPTASSARPARGPTGGAQQAAADSDLGDLGLDIPSIDTLSGPAVSEGAEVDLSSIGLDLAPLDDAPVAEGTDASRWQEMATKLDLASAYDEIGDREGARELLEEVLKGGDNAQQQKARAMLSKIS